MVRYYISMLLYFGIALFVQILLSDLFATITDLANILDQDFSDTSGADRIGLFDKLYKFSCDSGGNPHYNITSDPLKAKEA